MPVCRYCNAPVVWITTTNKKPMICERDPYLRDGSVPQPKGQYFDARGECYSQSDVPCKVKVWRSHWANCPGAAQVKADQRKQEELPL